MRRSDRKGPDTSLAERLTLEELWADLITLRGSPSAKLSERDKEFLNSCRERIQQYGARVRMTDKQRAWLDIIHAKNFPAQR
ncbi:MAG: hypothetical protein KDJ29_02300 [Hyphomicrobiales bacterium]|nr:hypothetical protein [Hyphomicrobiales bacterium]